MTDLAKNTTDKKQVDTDFKMRRELKGQHYHVTLFSKKRGNGTWGNIGKLVIPAEQWIAFLSVTLSIFIEDKST